MEIKAKTVLTGVVLNLIIFIAVTSIPAFQQLHHHWILPVLGSIISLEWALAGGLCRVTWLESRYDLQAARSAILFMLGILILMGVVRHQTILACYGHCYFKLGPAAALAAAVYFGQARLGDASFWNPARAYTAALACFLWAVFLVLFGLGLSAPKLDIIFIATTALLLQWRRFPAVKIVASAILPVLLVRRYFGEDAIIIINLAIACAGIYAAGRLAGPQPEIEPE